MSGPPPKPTAIRLLNGNPSKRPINVDEPKPVAGIPKCPAHLTGVARHMWGAVGKRLLASRVMTLDDGVALEMLVTAYAEFRRSSAVLRREGWTYVSSLDGNDDDGKPLGRVIIRPHPEVAMLQDAWRRVHGMLSEFGMTPASRSKVSATGAAATADPFEEMLSGGRRQA